MDIVPLCPVPGAKNGHVPPLPAQKGSGPALRALWQGAVVRSRSLVAETLAGGGLDSLALRTWPDGGAPSLRWIVCHMIEEYARHNGHADLLRESVDGSTGE
ncbi:mycothiol transferase [Arthrobacter sp. CG_A4]|uniref:mycothiol transferase n=1 Tax=Arthrobacter sp. CG_A4 TaxID=3071706 RepID=UPI002E0514FA|nr:hypothetical protein [Arthrobacter sp. CG_A4]